MDDEYDDSYRNGSADKLRECQDSIQAMINLRDQRIKVLEAEIVALNGALEAIR